MRKTRTLTLLACIVGLFMVVGLTACGSDKKSSSSSGSSGGGDTTASKEEPKTIAVNMYSRELPYFQEILKGLETEAKKYNWTIEPTFANNDPTQQINQVQNAVTKQPDAMVVVPIDENAIVPPIQQAKAANVPVMTMGDNVAESGRDAQLAFLGVNYVDLGKEKAQFMVDQLKGKGKIGWVHGIRGLNFSERQVEGAKPVFEGASGITLVDGPYTGAFSSDKGLSATENLLSRDPGLNALFFDNDDIALGGIQAIKDRGINQDKILVVATDGGPPALAAVKKGELDATISLCGYAQGVKAIDVLHDFLVNGTKPPAEIFTPTLLFTKDNLAKNIEQVKSGQC